MAARGREAQWRALAADEGCEYDGHDSINLSTLEPLIALPSSPGKVVPVTEVEGREIAQAYIGSSANPGLAGFRYLRRNGSRQDNPASRFLRRESNVARSAADAA